MRFEILRLEIQREDERVFVWLLSARLFAIALAALTTGGNSKWLRVSR